MRWASVVALCLASPVMAQTFEDEPWIDYDLLFELEADQVVIEPAGENGPVAVLNLPGEVRVERQGVAGSYTYRSSDCSPDGGIAMNLFIVMGVRAAARQCEGFVTPEQAARIGPVLDRIGWYVAENTVPPRSWGFLEPRFEDLLAHEMPLDCKDVLKEQGWWASFREGVTGDNRDAELDKLLAEPQLPVWGEKQCN
jgi:hypothetical protein